MKKWLAMTLVLVFTITLTACVPGLTAHQLEGIPETTKPAETTGATESPVINLPVIDADPNPQEQYVITAEEAKSIALQDALLQESLVRDLEVERDVEMGVYVYEVSFESGGKDYDYTIDGKTGQILHREQEFND